MRFQKTVGFCSVCEESGNCATFTDGMAPVSVCRDCAAAAYDLLAPKSETLAELRAKANRPWE